MYLYKYIYCDFRANVSNAQAIKKVNDLQDFNLCLS